MRLECESRLLSSVRPQFAAAVDDGVLGNTAASCYDFYLRTAVAASVCFIYFFIF